VGFRTSGGVKVSRSDPKVISKPAFSKQYQRKTMLNGCGSHGPSQCLLNPGFWLLTTPLLQLRQHLLAVLLDLRIVFFRILHRKTFFDKATAFILSAHLYVNRTESDVMH
jgi:hypothetical protein